MGRRHGRRRGLLPVPARQGTGRQHRYARGSKTGHMTAEDRAGSSTLAALVVILTWVAVAGAAEAKTYHVSPTGSDEHAGTEAQPLLSIQKAVDRARAGDTVLLHAGTYAQTVVLRHSGEEGKPI